MKIYEFNKYFPDEAACRRRFREWRDKEGVACQHCGSHDVVWLSVQALPAQDYAQKRHGDARLEAAFYVLVCGYAPADGYEEEYIGG